MTNTGDQRGYNLSLADTFTSIPLRGDGKNKTVQFISASTSDGPITPGQGSGLRLSGEKNEKRGATGFSSAALRGLSPWPL